MLTEQQRNELEAAGAANVRSKIAGYGTGRGASISGFTCGDITRGDIEDWLIEKNREETALQDKILFWARIAGVAGLVVSHLSPSRVRCPARNSHLCERFRSDGARSSWLQEKALQK